MASDDDNVRAEALAFASWFASADVLTEAEAATMLGLDRRTARAVIEHGVADTGSEGPPIRLFWVTWGGRRYVSLTDVAELLRRAPLPRACLPPGWSDAEPNPPLLTRAEAARALGCSPQQVSNLVRRGVRRPSRVLFLPALRVGKRFWVRPLDLDQFRSIYSKVRRKPARRPDGRTRRLAAARG